MNRDDIIRMAEEASGGKQPDGWGVMLDHAQLERFAALVAAAEREECAKIGEFYVKASNIQNAPDIAIVVKDYMRLIRARGQG